MVNRVRRRVTREEALEKFPRFTKSCEYFDEHSDELRVQYPDMWVVIDDGEVVLHSPELGRVLTVAEERHLSPAWTLLEFLNSKPVHPHPYHVG